MTNNIDKGKKGEALAKTFLINKGYTIVETNYKNKIGEIDIIAKLNDIIIFVEVKTRTNLNYGYAFEAVDQRKQRKIINTSLVYIKYKNLNNHQFRYDIIEVYLANKLIINHIENAFFI